MSNLLCFKSFLSQTLSGDLIPTFHTDGVDLYINNKKVIKAYESFSGWFWFTTEEAYKQDSLINGKVHENDTIFFGFVQGQFDEWGYFSKAELESLKPKIWEIKKQDLVYSGRRWQLCFGDGMSWINLIFHHIYYRIYQKILLDSHILNRSTYLAIQS